MEALLRSFLSYVLRIQAYRVIVQTPERFKGVHCNENRTRKRVDGIHLKPNV